MDPHAVGTERCLGTPLKWGTCPRNVDTADHKAMVLLAAVDALRPNRLRRLVAEVGQHRSRRYAEPGWVEARLGRLPNLEQQRRLVREEAPQQAALQQREWSWSEKKGFQEV